jgi:hypothetical protein
MAENETGGADREELKSSIAPSAPGEREQWLDAMADMQIQSDRRYNALNIRMTRIERKAGLEIPEEMKGFLLMLGLYIGVQLLLPLVIEGVQAWRSRT